MELGFEYEQASQANDVSRCPVCLNYPSFPVTHDFCHNYFCEECVFALIARAHSEVTDCPLCREPLSFGCVSFNHEAQERMFQSEIRCAVCSEKMKGSQWTHHVAEKHFSLVKKRLILTTSFGSKHPITVEQDMDEASIRSLIRSVLRVREHIRLTFVSESDEEIHSFTKLPQSARISVIIGRESAENVKHWTFEKALPWPKECWISEDGTELIQDSLQDQSMAPLAARGKATFTSGVHFWKLQFSKLPCCVGAGVIASHSEFPSPFCPTNLADFVGKRRGQENASNSKPRALSFLLDMRTRKLCIYKEDQLTPCHVIDNLPDSVNPAVFIVKHGVRVRLVSSNARIPEHLVF